MQYELGLFENLIGSGKSVKGSIKTNKGKKIENIVSQEVQRIKAKWRNKVFESDDERRIERYIQGHQKELINLANKAVEILGDDLGKQAIENPWVVIYKGLEELLTFIERYFSRYFDQDSYLPESYKVIALNDFKEWLVVTKPVLEERITDKRLCKLCFHPVEKFINRANEDVTFRKLIFLKELVKEITAIVQTEVYGKELNEKLRSLLFYLDYNSLRAYQYSINYITAYVNEAETMPQRIDRLAYAEKCINQAQVKPGFSFYPEYATMKVQLAVWVREEVRYAEQRKQLSISFASDAKPFTIEKNFKIKTVFSVPQLAYFIRLLVEVGIIKNRNITHLTDFLAKFIVTQRAEEISGNSLHTKFYAVEESARKKVGEFAIEMFNRTRKPLAKFVLPS